MLIELAGRYSPNKSSLNNLVVIPDILGYFLLCLACTAVPPLCQQAKINLPPDEVGGWLNVVICEGEGEGRRTPACCVGDNLRGCQCKHAGTTCSSRAGGPGRPPGTSAHNPSAPSEPTKAGETGVGGEFPEGRKWLCDSLVSDGSGGI